MYDHNSLPVRPAVICKISLLCGAVLLHACTTGPTPTTPPMPAPSKPVLRPPPAQPKPAPVDHKADNKLAFDSLDLQVIAFYPVQVNAVIRGTLADECTYLAAVTEVRQDTVFTLDITTQRDPVPVCPKPGAAFEYFIPLHTAKLPAGIYTVNVNQQQAFFEMPVDNGIPR